MSAAICVVTDRPSVTSAAALEQIEVVDHCGFHSPQVAVERQLGCYPGLDLLILTGAGAIVPLARRRIQDRSGVRAELAWVAGVELLDQARGSTAHRDDVHLADTCAMYWLPRAPEYTMSQQCVVSPLDRLDIVVVKYREPGIVTLVLGTAAAVSGAALLGFALREQGRSNIAAAPVFGAARRRALTRRAALIAGVVVMRLAHTPFELVWATELGVLVTSAQMTLAAI